MNDNGEIVGVICVGCGPDEMRTSYMYVIRGKDRFEEVIVPKTVWDDVMAFAKRRLLEYTILS